MEKRKEYRSAARSRRLIRQAFLELLREKRFEKITVTDIVARADINRSTFYAHYPDVRGLVEELLDETINDAMVLAGNTDFTSIFDDPYPFLRGLTIIGEDRMELYALLGKSEFALHLVEDLKTILLEKAVETMDIPEAIRTSTVFKIQITFFIGGILNAYQQWLQGNLQCSSEEIIEQMANLIVNNKGLYQELIGQ